ncbi:sensor domain-containing diguanylate cyclase [Caproicibacter fermentans]|uniref:GGDEF domain-containing protein n=1 Tax=Caproicibacter fermentans TaxID=2576756 RepID=A0A7G8TAP9_9FIRM|nr:sensor domain-containing diguanylate cyclase [Caproicibacter fermentans]QNK40690.1 GGDEF domain-containing protein [Caproicibacter fermentans]
MKGKSFWFLILGFSLSEILTALLTDGFHRIAAESVILSSLVSLVLLLAIWYRYVDKPTSDFLDAINRAMRGDFRARFSCYDENDNFHRLSVSFNRLMTCVENQTEELKESRRLQIQLYENEKIYRSALELTCERIFEADLTHNRLIYGLEGYQRAFSFLNTEMFDDMIHSIADHAVYEEDQEKFFQTFDRRNLLETFRASQIPEITLEYRQRLPSGTLKWVSSSVIRSGNSGDGLKVIGYVKNIDERKKQELEILKQSRKDGLTGIYNKSFTQTLIEDFLAGTGKSGRHAAIMIDIDNFKRINDTLGHIQGDTALSQVAQKLSGLFRCSDIVGRIGGDEFFVFMKDYSSSDTLTEKLNAVKNLFGEIRLEDSSYRVSGSVGVSLYPEDGAEYRELYKKADHALYYSKAHGKNQYHIYVGNTAENQKDVSSKMQMIQNPAT